MLGIKKLLFAKRLWSGRDVQGVKPRGQQDNQSPQDSAEPIKSDEETVEIPHTSVEDSINIAHAQQTRRADSLISSLPFTSQVGNDDIESHENKENEGGNNFMTNIAIPKFDYTYSSNRKDGRRLKSVWMLMVK